MKGDKPASQLNISPIFTHLNIAKTYHSAYHSQGYKPLKYGWVNVMNMLTAAGIERLRKKSAGKRTVMHSIERGLYLEIRIASGRCGYVFRYQLPDGKRSTLALGDINDMSLEDAEALAQKCRNWLKAGSDPRLMLVIHEQSTTSAVLSVKDALEYWLNHCTRKYPDNARKAFARHIYPHAGAVALDSMTTANWVTLLDAISTGKHTGRRAPVVAGRVLADIKCAVRYCRARSMCQTRALDDLSIGVIGKSAASRDRQLSDNELRDVLNWTTRRDALPYYRALVRLLVVFGARTAELRLSRLGEWNLTKQIWTVPAAHSKNGTEIVRPIPDGLMPFVRSLVDAARDAGSELLLTHSRAASTVSKTVGQLHKRLGHAHWTAHDTRRTLVTRMNENGADPHVVESLVGHSLPGMARRYNYAKHLAAKRTAMDEWLSQLNKIERQNILMEIKHG